MSFTINHNFNKNFCIFILLFSSYFIFAQTPIQQFWTNNVTPATMYWDNTANNSQIDNGNGNWDYITPNWININYDQATNQNIIWKRCSNAVFGGNLGINNAGTITLSTIFTNTSPLNVKSLTFQPTSGGNFNISGQYITSCSNTFPITVSNGLNPSIGSVLQGAFTLVKNGAGSLSLSGNNTYSSTNVANGILNITGAGVIGSGSLNLSSSTTANFSSTSVQTLAGISGNGNFNVNNTTFRFLFPSNQTFNGAVTFSNATMNHGNQTNGGSLTYNGNISITGTNNFLGQVGPSNATVVETYSGAITGTGSINIGASSGAPQNNTNQYRINLNSVNNTFSGGFTLSGSGLGFISGIFGNVFAYSLGTGDVTLNGYFGKSWRLTLMRAGAISPTANLYIRSYYNLSYYNQVSLNGFDQTIASLASANDSYSAILDNGSAANCTITINQNNNTTYSGRILNGSTGTLSVIKQGTGILTLRSDGTTIISDSVGFASNYSGGTTINGGTIICSKSTGLGTGNVTINNGGTLSLSARSITNTITVNPGGTLNLNGNTTGTITNNGGTVNP